MVNKTHIIDGAESGKITLAKRLSECLGCPSYDLDLTGWRDHQKVSLPERLNAIEAILSQPSWVT